MKTINALHTSLIVAHVKAKQWDLIADIVENMPAHERLAGATMIEAVYNDMPLLLFQRMLQKMYLYRMYVPVSFIRCALQWNKPHYFVAIVMSGLHSRQAILAAMARMSKHQSPFTQRLILIATKKMGMKAGL
jgi:hypothetical protein